MKRGLFTHTSLGVFLDITEEEVGFTWPFPKPLAGYGAFSGKYLQLLDGKGVVVFYGQDSWLVMPNRLGRLGRLGPVHARCRANTGLKNCIVFPPQTRMRILVCSLAHAILVFFAAVLPSDFFS